mgnify:CR=1 FL=1
MKTRYPIGTGSVLFVNVAYRNQIHIEFIFFLFVGKVMKERDMIGMQLFKNAYRSISQCSVQIAYTKFATDENQKMVQVRQGGCHQLHENSSSFVSIICSSSKRIHMKNTTLLCAHCSPSFSFFSIFCLRTIFSIK